MKFKLRKVGTSWGIIIPKKIAEPYIASGEIEFFFTQAPVTSGYAASGETVPLKSVTTVTGEVPMTKEEKLVTLRTMIAMTGDKHTEEEIQPLAVEDPDEVVYDDTDDIPEELRLKPEYQHLRGKK